MSHGICEVVIPLIDNMSTQDAVAKVMAEFNECPQDDDDRSPWAFWDWWVIGGRFASHKLTTVLDEKKLDEFSAQLTDLKVTISPLRCGKKSIQPKSQIPMVDNIWSELFPEHAGACPFFEHYSDQYSNEFSKGDIMPLGEITEQWAHTVIIAGPGHNGELCAQHVVHRQFFTGHNFQNAAWDGRILSAVEEYKSKLEHYTEEAREKLMPRDDWQVITVDYHS